MKKNWIFVICIILIFSISFYIGIKIISSQSNKENNTEINNSEIMETTASEDEKISPNAILIIRTYYEKCKHTNEKIETISNELVNVNQEELQKKYSKWNIESFEKDKVILKESVDEWCKEHFVLKDENGHIVVYNIQESEEENLYLNTNIATEYLPATDKHALSKGIYIYGKKELNEILQDFE